MTEKTYQELLAERAALDAKIDQKLEKEKSEAIARVKKDIADYRLQASDLFSRRTSTARKPVKPKYRDPVSGAEWTGRGKTPKWIQNQDRTKFLIRSN